MTALLTFDAGDISLELAESAFRLTSMDPERRGRGIVRDYVSHMEALAQEFAGYADETNRDPITEALERYREGYVRRLHAYLSAHSRTASSFVTGPANFPVASNRKRMETSDRRLDELMEYSKKVLEKLRDTYDPKRVARAQRLRGIRSTDDDAIEQLEAKIEAAQERQELMKAANRIVRRKIADEEKVRLLHEELGIAAHKAPKLLEADFMGRVGFPDYALQNNNANIRRMKGRIEEIKALQAAPAAEERVPLPQTELSEEPATVRRYEEDGRVCIAFPGKPDSATRTLLKSNGFKWAPSRGAWVRQATQNGRLAAQQVMLKLTGVPA